MFRNFKHKRALFINYKRLLVTLLRAIWWRNCPGCESHRYGNPAVLAADFRCAARAENFCSVLSESSAQGFQCNCLQSSLNLL